MISKLTNINTLIKNALLHFFRVSLSLGTLKNMHNKSETTVLSDVLAFKTVLKKLALVEFLFFYLFQVDRALKVA